MRVVVLKIGPGGVGSLVRYYDGLARDQLARDGTSRGPVDYYIDADEPPGRWWGTGRHAVGLGGDVLPGQLARMLQAQHPATGRKLGRGFGETSARSFDATFSAPKSISLLWALTKDETVRAEVLAAHDTAVETALGWLERHGTVTRRGRDGVDQVDACGLTVALFRQHTSRTLDPQLHTHAIVWSKVQDRTGRWLSLDARFLVCQQRSIGWVYDAALRVELTRRLGVDWEAIEPGLGQSDVVGVPAGLRRVFSTRSDQVAAKQAELVQRWTDEHGGAEPDQRTIARLQRAAVLASRPGKEHGVDATVLRGEWRATTRAAGFDPDRLGLGQARLPGLGVLDRDAVVAEAVRRVAEAGSVWLRADLAREIATLVPAGTVADAAELVDLVDELAAQASGRCVELHPRADPGVPCRSDGRPVSEHVTDRYLTTTAVLEQEGRLIDWATNAVEPAQGTLGGDRQRVVADAISGHGRMVLVVGPAGAGKTTVVRTGAAGLAAEGRAVVGLAPSGKAADVLASTAGIEATTLAKFLYQHRRPGGPASEWALRAGATLVVDEAGMASTEDLDQLVGLAERHRWRLVCVGDPEQLPAVGRGGVFAYWCDTLRAHHLDEVRRFSELWQAQASLGLRRGDPVAARSYVERGRVHTVHPALLAHRVARQYAAARDAGRSVAITTAAAGTARAINTEIQYQLHLGQRPGRSVELRDGSRVMVGDQIATRRNASTRITDGGVAVRNRQTWTVTAISAAGDLTVTDPEHGTVTLPGGYVGRHVELGWAVTGYGSQGVTVDRGICVVEPSSSRAGIYVGMTRGRGHNTAWIIDPVGNLDPADAFADAIARPPNARTAHATRARLYDAKGLTPPGREVEALAPEDPGARSGDRVPAARGLTPLLRVVEPVPAEDDLAARIRVRLDRLEQRPRYGRSLGR